MFHSAHPVRSLRVRPLTTFVTLALAAGATAAGAGASQSGAARATVAAPHGRTAELLAGTAPLSPLGVMRIVENCNDSGPGSLRETYFLSGDQDTVDLRQLACSHITL